MASLRRNNTFSTDSPAARFLYTIIKQLDLKSIDWNLVAASHGITNGHAARMRYSRFKQHMEGVTTQPKTTKAAGKKEKEGKEEKQGKEVKEGSKKGKKRVLEEEPDEKNEAGSPVKREKITMPNGAGVGIKNCETRIKHEPLPDAAPAEVHIKTEPGLLSVNTPFPPSATGTSPPEIRIKPEPAGDTNPDIWRILPPRPGSGSNQSLLQPPHPADQQKTVSLADLEVSPRRQQPATITRHADADAFLRHTFGDSGVASDGGGSVKVKMEPGLHDGDCVMGTSTEVVVKRESLGESWMDSWDGDVMREY